MSPGLAPAAGGALALTPPSPPPHSPAPSLPGQRCQDLLVQLYLQRPELRVHAPEALLRSMGATASSICKVSRALPRACCFGGGGHEGHVSRVKTGQEPAAWGAMRGQPCALTPGRRPDVAGLLGRQSSGWSRDRVFLRPVLAQPGTRPGVGAVWSVTCPEGRMATSELSPGCPLRAPLPPPALPAR